MPSPETTPTSEPSPDQQPDEWALPEHWLRREIGDAGVRKWILDRRGRGLSPPQLRFWELILELDKAEVDRRLTEREGDSWHERTRRSLETTPA